MPLVFRNSQNIPLTNAQLDGNFQYLLDEINLKYTTSNFTAANISTAINTPAFGQSASQLVQSNNLDAWKLRSIVPSESVPVAADKTSIPVRSSGGLIYSTGFVGYLNGNADTATIAAVATVANAIAPTASPVPIALGGTGSASASAARIALGALHIGGDQPMVGKLRLVGVTTSSASINFGENTGVVSNENKVNGDMWATPTGFFFHVSGVTKQIAGLESPTFSGIPQAPGYSGTPSQIITLSHLNEATSLINSSIALKANINSPTFTGIPSAPTASSATNTTQIATTQFVQTLNTSTTNSITNAYTSYTTNAIIAERNSINVVLNAKANLDSPNFTGVPTAPTPSAGTSDTKIATTFFVSSALASYTSTFNSSISSLTQQVQNTRPVPVGAVFYMLKDTIPDGYLEANGQAVSRTTYSDLWNYLGQPNTGNGTTTFNLPDLRGEFIRCWDDGRGIDAGRTLGSIQYSQNQDHYHASPNPVDTVATNVKYPFGYVEISEVAVSQISDSDGTTGFVAKTQSVGGSEARPRNIALVAVIKW